jgi:hypothetical protein
MKATLFAVVFAVLCPLALAGGCGRKMAPPPYTADQIRAANRPGTVYRYKVEALGQPVQIRVMEFTAGGSEETAEVKNLLLDEAGKPMRPPSVDRAPWDAMRSHGEFPEKEVTITSETIEVPAGKFDTTVYTVRGPEGETMRFYFAKSYAGPPVLFYTERAGMRVMTSTLIERKSGG